MLVRYRDEAAQKRSSRQRPPATSSTSSGKIDTDRQAQPTDDLLSLLVHAEVDGERLDNYKVISESLLILIGGDETTRHVISGGMYQLLAEPARWKALGEDRSLLPTTIEEMLPAG